MTDSQIRTEFVKAGDLTFEVDICDPAPGTDNGKLAIFLHGFPENSFSWRFQMPMMAARGYTCWAPNQRGYKGSDKPKGVQEYAIEKLMDDVGNLIDAAGKSETVLIAHDWGAVIAWYFAIRQLRPLERLIIMNVPHPAVMSENMKKARRQLLKSWYIFSFQIPWLPEFFMRLGGAKAVRAAFYNMAIDKSRFPDEVLDEYSRPVLEDKKALTAMINYYRAIVRGGGRRQQALGFPNIETPTLMVWGEEDSALDKAMTYGTDKVCDDFTIRYLPQVSHWVQQEAPEKVNAIMEAWLDGGPVPEAADIKI